MSCERTVVYEFQVQADDLAARLFDPAFIHRRCLAAGDVRAEVSVEHVDEGVRTHLVRDRQLDLPTFARRYIGGSRQMIEEHRWSRAPGYWRSDFTVVVRGLPGDVRGRIALLPSSAGCRYECTFEVTCRVPLFAARLEELLAQRLAEGLAHTARCTAEMFAVA